MEDYADGAPSWSIIDRARNLGNPADYPAATDHGARMQPFDARAAT